MKEDGIKNKKFKKDEIIIKEGTTGNEIFFIKSGSVKVYKTFNDEILELGILRKGDFFGELSCFLGHERTATVQALEDTVIMIGDKKSFFASIKRNPEMAEKVIMAFARRLIDAHRALSEMQDQKTAYKLIFQPFMDDFK